MADNLRSSVPRSSANSDLSIALQLLADRVAELRTASRRGLPSGFRWHVERLADGRARLSIHDVARDISQPITEW